MEKEEAKKNKHNFVIFLHKKDNLFWYNKMYLYWLLKY